MFNVNPNSGAGDDFKSRSKSVFDTLASLESVHNVKAKEYIDPSLDTYDPEANSSDATRRGREETKSTGEFKVPQMPPPRPQSSSGYKRKHNEPDHVRNPHKWKRYSLEDVKESDMSASANYQAAMSFLNRNDKHEIDQNELKNIEFNRPIGKKRATSTTSSSKNEERTGTKSSILEENKIEEENDEQHSFSSSRRQHHRNEEDSEQTSGFKKKGTSRKINIRRNDDDDDDKEEDNEVRASLRQTNKRENKQRKSRKETDDDDEFEGYSKNDDGDNETSEFGDNYY